MVHSIGSDISDAFYYPAGYIPALETQDAASAGMLAGSVVSLMKRIEPYLNSSFVKNMTLRDRVVCVIYGLAFANLAVNLVQAIYSFIYPPHPTHPIMEYFGTSDHTTKTFDVSVRRNPGDNDPLFWMTISTLNALDFCRGMKNGKPGNNPLNYFESPASYSIRKHKQILEMEAMIRKENTCIAALQEVDFIYQGEKLINIPLSELKEYEKVYLQLYVEFKSMLARNKRKILMTNPSLGKEKQDHLVILYDPARMDPMPHIGRADDDFHASEEPENDEVEASGSLHLKSCFKQGGQFRGGEIYFREKTSQITLKIVNVHLKFDVDCKEELDGRLRDPKASLTIILGDFNRAPSEDFRLVANPYYATNVDATDRSDPRTLTDMGSENEKKAFDGAFFGCDLGSLNLTERGDYFEKRANGKGFEVRAIPDVFKGYGRDSVRSGTLPQQSAGGWFELVESECKES